MSFTEHMDPELMKEMVTRMTGDIHAYGETNHDNQARKNLDAFGKLFLSMLDELVEESYQADSYMRSLQENGERSLKILKDAFDEIQDVLLDAKIIEANEED